jgi:membrane-bound metal-dependent hydrolase YbcI (DUF457 family)
MLIPTILFILLIALILLAIGAARKSIALLATLVGGLWLMAFVSAFFVGWAWLERNFSENWALYGVLYFSLPITACASALAGVTIIAARLRKIRNFRKIEISLYLLLLFLIVQAAFGWWMLG